MADPFAALEVTPTTDPFAVLETAPVDPFAALETSPTTDPFAALETTPSTAEAIVRGGAQGLSFNTADEATATAYAIAAKAKGDTRPFKDILNEQMAETQAKYKAAQTAHPVAFGGAEIASSLAVPGVGWLKGGATLGKAVKAGMTAGALQGAGAAEGGLTERAKGAATGAALGAAGGATVHGALSLFKLAKPIADSTFADTYLKTLSSLETRPPKVSMEEALTGNDPRFVKYVLKGKTTPDDLTKLEKFDKVIGQWSPEKQQEIFREFDTQAKQIEAAKIVTGLSRKGLGLSTPESLDSWVTLFRPASQNAQRVDQKSGTNFTDAVLSLITAENRHGTYAAPWLVKATDLERKLQERAPEMYKNDPQMLHRMVFSNIERGNFKPGSIESEVVDLFKAAKNDLNTKLGTNIQDFLPAENSDIINYLTHTRMPMTDIRIKLDTALDKIAKGELPAEEVKMFRDSVKYLADDIGAKVDLKSVASVRRFIDSGLAPVSTAGRVGSMEAGAAFARDANIPPYLMERNVFKLLGNYVDSNAAAALYNGPLLKLDAQIDTAKAMGMMDTVKYFTQVRDKILGNPSNFKLNVARKTAEWKIRGDRLIREGQEKNNKYLTAIGSFNKVMPDLMPWVMSNMYTNTLALNPYAVLRQFGNVPTLGLPDIAKDTGLAYASRATTQGTINSLKNNIFKHVSLNKAMGIHKEGPPESYITKSIEEGLRSSGVPEFIIKSHNGYEHLSKKLMAIYSGADDINRNITANIAHVVADDMFSKNAGFKTKALQYLNNMPPAYAQSVRKAVAQGNQIKTRELLRNYMVLKHQYSYTTADLNSLGREYGSILTAFTKFPLSVISDVENEIYKHGMAGAYPITAKYLAPLAVLATVDSNLKDQAEERNPALKLMLGESMMDLSPILGAGVGAPPIVSVPYKTMGVLAKGIKESTDKEMGEMPKHVAKTAGKMVKASSSLLPGYGLYDYTKRRLQRAGIIEKDTED